VNIELLRQKANEIYSAQSFTVADYGDQATDYADDLMRLAADNDWLSDLDKIDRYRLHALFIEMAENDITAQIDNTEYLRGLL
jgi:hypothetical protein